MWVSGAAPPDSVGGRGAAPLTHNRSYTTPWDPTVVTSVITGVCGNIGQWQGLTKSEVVRRSGNEARYFKLYAEATDRLISSGYLLASERKSMLSRAAADFRAAAEKD